MLKNKKLIIVTVAGLTLVGNMAIAPKCFAYTSDKNLSANEHVLTTKQKHKDKKDKVKTKRKKNHKGHNKKYIEILHYEYEFEITKPPIRGIDFDNETIDPYIDVKPVEEKESTVNPSDVETSKTPIKEKDNDAKKETAVIPVIDTHIDKKPVEEKESTVNPSDVETSKTPIKEKENDNKQETTKDSIIYTPIDGELIDEAIPTVNPYIDPYIDGTPIGELIPTVNPYIDPYIDGTPIGEAIPTVNPYIDPYIDGTPIEEAIPTVDPIIYIPIEGELINEGIGEENGSLVKPANNLNGNKEIKEEKINLDINKNKNADKESVVKKMPKVNNLKAEKKVLEDNKKGTKNISDENELPKTGTNNFKTLLLGGALFILGIAMSLFSRKKANQ
ncbi:LPXTG cell wall anchor domain-containing protein [Clostridium botulinum]|uniref:LPXTG cell wall anchor domain-containing protein n=2 Tax=Clostridium botulinum TaxID=1491 RepID=UPI0013F134D9|nr:LPXTG cell wall anchor domain-containing protein [Clostridium botulinum]MCD3196736.1 LPXTG cell wall anchor domain-containing protein [Clostridium botulinum C/D]MCD3201583.1 LPXTG cell wall anchor domain-containing protein [Clostridium botulinum C/D]MCD3211558.1 LPXTG cell wall anchor domain-containing protein [Clostridium botulinum C/D]MCD3213313.1 LPXTG cell wall anchor domain-containing protein [Clostridium botulinum C/D]MCD3222573.1 LPXTG cell wall anchor domain-containing protein [Clos